MTETMTGRRIFLNQLAMMANDEKITEFLSIDINKVVDIQTFSEEEITEEMLMGEEIDVQELKVLVKAKEFQVPENLLTAFYAYYLEYFYPDGCLHVSGPFWNEDTKDGIKDKIFYFFEPIFGYVAQKYCPEYPEFVLRTIIEPYYDDSSSIFCITRPYYGCSVLPVQVVLYDDNWKVWRNPFRGSDRAEDVYRELMKIYNVTADNAIKAFKLLAEAK